MAAQTFPYGRAKVLLEGYSTQKVENFRRTTLEDGAIAQRRSNSSGSYNISADVAVKQNDFEYVSDWLSREGRNWFNFRDLRTGDMIEARLTEEPVFEYAAGRLEGQRHYRASLSLESNPVA